MGKRFSINKKLCAGLISVSMLIGSLSTFPVMASEFSSGEVTSGEIDIFSDASEENFDISEEEIIGEDIVENAEEASVEEGEIFASEITEAEFFSEDTQEIEETEEGIRYIKGRPLTEEEREEQLAPMRNLKPLGEPVKIKENPAEVSAAAATYPSKYDSRKQKIITSIKDQNPYGLCWGFSLASVLETSLLKQGKGTFDLSEEHLAYFFSHRVNDPLKNTAGDKIVHNVLNWDGVRDYHESGNPQLASIFLSTWSGMALEADFPLKTNSDRTQYVYNTWPNSAAYKTAAYQKDMVFADYSEVRMKELIMKYGSVSIMYNANEFYLNPDTAAYCYPVNSWAQTNHVVTVVGWDDSYSKNNFSYYSGVTRNGAWITKNSWGTEWGDNGYLYLSYQDPTITGLVTGTVETAPKYKNNYFYDGTAGSSTVSIFPGEAVAAVFTAKAGKDKAEILGEIVTTVYSNNNKYEIQVYTDIKDDFNPQSGVKAYASPFKYTQKDAGIDTISIPEVTLMAGERYAVVIKNIGNNSVDYCVESADDYGWVKFIPNIDGKQTYIYYNNYWHDASDQGYRALTMRVKAHTRTVNEKATLKLNKTSLTLYKGDKTTLSATVTPATLKAKGVKYKSSDKSVATIGATTGKVTAQGAGTATFTCMSNSYPYSLIATCKVTVLPSKPQNTKAVVYDTGKIKLSWEKEPGATGYIIYRKVGNGTMKKYLTIKNGKNSYIDQKNLKVGTKYTYKVIPYILLNNQQTLGKESAEFSVTMTLASPAVTAKTNSAVYNTLTWNKVNGAQGYAVYRRIKGQKWSKLKDLSAAEYNASVLTYKDKTAESLVKYEYSVRPWCKIDNKVFTGAYKCSNVVTTAPKKQKITSITSKSNGLYLKWVPQKKCSGYVIYRKTGNGSYKKLVSLSGGSKSAYTDKTAKKGVTYSYYVKAYIKESYGTIFSKYTTYKKKF